MSYFFDFQARRHCFLLRLSSGEFLHQTLQLVFGTFGRAGEGMVAILKRLDALRVGEGGFEAD